MREEVHEEGFSEFLRIGAHDESSFEGLDAKSKNHKVTVYEILDRFLSLIHM